MDVDEEKLLSITQAAKLLGIHSLTLRNWADKGHIPCYRTPGGHRRFRKRELLDFLAKMNQGPPGAALVTVAHHAVQQAIATFPTRPPEIAQPVWQKELTEQQRTTMRSVGQKLLGLTIQYAAGNANETVLNKGRELGYTYGKFARRRGASMSETVATFNFFRDTIIEATFDVPANSVDIDASAPQLYRRLNYFLNEVLLATVEAAEGVIPEMVDNGR
jgi:excisionase family DNA binding protein